MYHLNDLFQNLKDAHMYSLSISSLRSAMQRRSFHNLSDFPHNLRLQHSAICTVPCDSPHAPVDGSSRQSLKKWHIDNLVTKTSLREFLWKTFDDAHLGNVLLSMSHRHVHHLILGAVPQAHHLLLATPFILATAWSGQRCPSWQRPALGHGAHLDAQQFRTAPPQVARRCPRFR